MTKNYTTTQVAKILGLSRIRVFQLIKEGKIKATNLKKANLKLGYVISAAEVGRLAGERFLKNNKSKTNEEI